MTLEITGLRSETLKALEEKARKFGKTMEEYARDLIEEDVSPREQTIDEILAPFRREVEESGITDEELDELFMQARRDYYREQMERK
jgi:phytoene/squalene synthetase